MENKKNLLRASLISSALLSTSMAQAFDFNACMTQCKPDQCQKDANKAKSCVEFCKGIPTLASYFSACQNVVAQEGQKKSAQNVEPPKATPSVKEVNNTPKTSSIPKAPPLPTDKKANRGDVKNNPKPTSHHSGQNHENTNKGSEIKEMMGALGHLDQDLKTLYRKIANVDNSITLKRLEKEKIKLEKKRGKLAGKIKEAGGKNIPLIPKSLPQKIHSDHHGGQNVKNNRPLPKPGNPENTHHNGHKSPDIAPPNAPPPPPFPNSPKAPKVKKPHHPSPAGGRGALLEQIQKGKNLKHVDPRSIEKAKEEKKSESNSMMGALKAAMDKRRQSMNNSSEDHDDDSSWD